MVERGSTTWSCGIARHASEARLPRLILTAIILLAPIVARSAPAPAPAPAEPTVGAPPSARIPVTTEQPSIDGRLKEACWKTAPVVGRFFDIDEGTPAAPETIVQVLNGGRWLYVGVTCKSDDITQALAERTRDNSDVFNDDSVEVLIDPIGYHARVYRFVLNSIGTRMGEVIPFDGRGVGDAPPCWLGRARPSDPGEPSQWTAEFAIDVVSLDPGPSSEGRWRANFIRHVRQPGRADSAWARPRFWRFGCDKKRMGVLSGMPTGQAATGCTLRVAKSVIRPSKGILQGDLEVELTNALADKRKFDVMLRTPTRWMTTRQVEVGGRQRVAVDFQFEMALAEPRELKIEAHDIGRRLPAAAIAHPFTPQPVIAAQFDRNYYTSEQAADYRVEIAEGYAGSSVELQLYNSQTGREAWSDTISLGTDPDAPRKFDVQVPLADLPVGGYLMETVYEDKSEGLRYRKWASLRRLPEKPYEVKILRDGHFLRGGNPFYPIEVRRVSGSPQEVYDAIRTEASFNINWGWYVRYRGNANYVKNLYKATGCLGDINVDDLYYQREPGRSSVVALVQEYATLPIMFSYGMESLPGRESYTTEPVATAYQYMQTIDPYRPFYVTLGDSRQARRIHNHADYLVVRCPATAPGNVAEPEWVYENVRRAREGAGPHIPVVALLPGYEDAELNRVRPSAEHMYGMTYMALVAGAAGIIFDGFHYKVREDPLKRGFSDDPRLRAMIFALSKHVAYVGPILGTADVSDELICEQPQYGSIRWTARRYNGKLYIIAANASTRHGVAAFRPLGEFRFGKVEDVLGKSQVASKSSRFSHDFSSYEARIFAIEVSE